MASQAIYDQPLYDMEQKPSQPFLLRDVLPGPAWAPCQARANDDYFVSKADMSQGSCIRGALAAIFLEGIAAASVYGLWLLWHAVR